MAFIQISSTNPEFSYFIKKNPSSPMQIKSLRKGTIFGYYTKNKENQYNVFFRDNRDDSSFSTEFSYLNTSQFSSADFVLNAINLFFSHNLKNKDERDTHGYIHTIKINCLDVKSLSFVSYLEKYFSNIKFEYKEISPKHIELTLSSSLSFHYLINSLSLIIMFNIFNRFEYIEESLLEKYVSCINVIDAPYFIRYLFKRFLPQKKFKNLKSLLEDSKSNSLVLTQGNNMDSRKRFVSENLDFSRNIVDLGCGEGAYLHLSKKTSKYFAIDKDPLELEKAKDKSLKKELDNISFLNNLDELKTKEDFDLIFIEVMEHMPLSDAQLLLKKVLELSNLKTLLITTPNSLFNPHYAIDGFRHDDHDFEMTTSEFEDFCQETFKGLDYEIVQIGDLVDGISPTQGVKVWK